MGSMGLSGLFFIVGMWLLPFVLAFLTYLYHKKLKQLYMKKDTLQAAHPNRDDWVLRQMWVPVVCFMIFMLKMSLIALIAMPVLSVANLVRLSRHSA